MNIYLARLVESPKGRYNGHVLINAVESGMRPTRPHQDLKYKPAAPMARPITTLIHLSVIPIFFYDQIVFIQSKYKKVVSGFNVTRVTKD